jgi:hypothetical protein
MPFGMGRAGWLMWPYFAQWLQYSHRFAAPHAAPCFYPSMTREETIAYLQEQAKMLKREYDRINTRLKELQKTE